jgi:hypothetical protein
VPGIISSATTRRNLKAAVVGANEPMPSVSKKFVTKPMARCSTPGFAGAPADSTRAMRNQRHAQNAPSAAITASRMCAVVTPRA